jgi:hypothetical protein
MSPATAQVQHLPGARRVAAQHRNGPLQRDEAAHLKLFGEGMSPLVDFDKQLEMLLLGLCMCICGKGRQHAIHSSLRDHTACSALAFGANCSILSSGHESAKGLS